MSFLSVILRDTNITNYQQFFMDKSFVRTMNYRSLLIPSDGINNTIIALRSKCAITCDSKSFFSRVYKVLLSFLFEEELTSNWYQISIQIKFYFPVAVLCDIHQIVFRAWHLTTASILFLLFLEKYLYFF